MRSCNVRNRNFHIVNSISHHTKPLSVGKSDRFYPFSFYFCKYSFLKYSVFNDIFYVNDITYIFDNNLYITGLLNWDNKFLYCNCKMAGESITLFQQENKFKVYKIFITSKNNSVFLIIIFIIFRIFSRKQNMCLRLCYVCFLVFDSFFKIPNQRWFSFQFKNDFFSLKTNILSSCSRHNITQNFCFFDSY